MALNFTPLSAYKFDVLSGIRQQAENRRQAAEGIGAILGTAKGIADAQKTRDFFAQFDDSEEIARLTAELKANEDRIKELKEERKTLGVD